MSEKLEIWDASTHTYLVSEIILFSAKTLLILLISAFFTKNQHFLGKYDSFTQSNSVRPVLEIF